MQAEVLERVGRYEIVGELGAGAMSRVFLAHDPNLDRQVAVKVVLRGFSLDSKEQTELERRFLLEARAAGKLSHPGIVRVYDADKDPNLGIPYIAMEWVQGRSLRNLLDEGGRLNGSRTLDILGQVARALDYAHRAGRIHRDIKPSNILIGPDGVAKVSDFGVAKIVSETHTVSGQILGTPAYMSPEQVRDDPLDGRSDLFSLGAVLYQCVSGTTPFGGDSLVQVVYKILNVDPRPLELVSTPIMRELAAVTERALQKDPNRRYQTGAEFAEALDRVREGMTDGPETGFHPSRPRTEPPEALATVPRLEIFAARLSPADDPDPHRHTRTVQLSTTSIHRAAALHDPPNETPLAGLETVVTTLPAAVSKWLRYRYLLAAALGIVGLTALLTSRGIGGTSTPSGEPIEVFRVSATFDGYESTEPVLRFPAQPEPDPGATTQPVARRVAPTRPTPEPSLAAVVEPTDEPTVADMSPGPEQTTQVVDPPLPSTILTPVAIRYRHKGGPAFLSVSLDGQRVWSQELEAVEGRLQKLTGYEARAVVPVPSGTHTLQVALTDPDRGIETAGSIRSRYTSGARRALRVSVDPGANSLQLRWKE